MKSIALTQGKFAVVDDLDFEKVAPFRWSASKSDNTFYAVSYHYVEGRRKRLLMHRLILGDSCRKVDHRDGDGLNNTRSNLRPANDFENSRNCMKPKTATTSKYKGVSRSRGGFQAAIRFNRVKVFLGRFKDEKQAALAYNSKATELFGEFAKLNQVE